jgi:NhaA family Na+:H+ antiporter
MVFFFLLVTLEIKREILEGHLARPAFAAFPAAAAVGGMALPGAIYAAVNWPDPAALRGWAIPTATDIVLALAVLSLLRARVTAEQRVFLTALAVLDDVGGIVIIAASSGLRRGAHRSPALVADDGRRRPQEPD